MQIDFRKKEQNLQISVKDNGQGWEEENRPNSKKSSVALQVLRERLELLNHRLKTKARLEISKLNQSGNGETGTEVTFYLPLQALS